MNGPKYSAIITVPIFANSVAEAHERIAPYLRDMRVDASVEIVAFVAPEPVPQSMPMRTREGDDA